MSSSQPNDYGQSSQGRGLQRVFTLQLVAVFSIMLVLISAYSLISFIKSRHTLAKLQDFHGPALVSVINMRSRSNNAIQEAFAYVISGEVIEKEEFLEWTNSFAADVNEFREIGQVDQTSEASAVSALENVVASQRLMTNKANQMFSEYESTHQVNIQTFHDYETVIDEFGRHFEVLERLERTRYNQSQQNAAKQLQATAFELPILGVVSVLLCTSLFGLLVSSFRRYSADQELSRLELVEKERRHRAFLDNLPELIWVADTDKQCTFFNRTWLEFTGRTLQQEQGSGWADGVHPDDSAECWKTYESAFDDRKPFCMEYRLRRNDGQYRWVLDTGTPQFEVDGRFAGYIGGCIDITDRRRADESLRQRDQAIRNAITPIAFADLDGCITEANLAFADLFGMADPQQAIGKLNTEFHAEPVSVAEMNRLVIQNGGFEEEFTSKRIDGTPIDLKISATLSTDEKDRPIGQIATFMDITGRRRAERALRDSEQHYRTLTEAAPEAIVVLDVDKRCFVEINESAEKMFRLSREQLFATGPAKISPPLQPDGRESAPAAMEYIQQALDGEMPVFDWVHLDSDGNQIQCEIRLTRLASDRPLVRSSITDISERKRTEEVEKSLGRIVEESLNEIYIFDMQSLKFIQVNRGARENLGYSLDEMRELTPLDLKTDHTQESFAELVQPLRSGEKQLVQFQTCHRRKDGSSYDVEVRLQTATYRGCPVFVAMIHDMSERIELENTLSRRALEAELLHQAVAMADETDSLDAALQKCVEIVCELADWPVGHAWVPDQDDKVLRPTNIWHFDSEKLFAKFRDVTNETSFVMGEGLPGRIWKSGEPAWIDSIQEDRNFARGQNCQELNIKSGFGFPIKVGRKTIAILEFFNDVAVARNETLLLLVRSVGEQVGRVIERKEAQEASQRHHEMVAEELEKAKSELVLRTRLAAVGQMSAQIAHEMRNPLGAVSNAIFFLKRHVPANEKKWAEYLDLIDGEVATCNQFIGDLLDVTRAKEPDREATNLVDIVDRVVARHEIPCGIDIQIACQPDPFVVFADHDQVLQVIDNLLQNALDAIGEKPGRIELRAHRDHENDIISIHDSGTGISTENQASVFDVLFTTKPTGTGLGLPICKQIIEGHGGTIELVNGSLPGTTFQVQLPCMAVTQGNHSLFIWSER